MINSTCSPVSSGDTALLSSLPSPGAPTHMHTPIGPGTHNHGVDTPPQVLLIRANGGRVKTLNMEREHRKEPFPSYGGYSRNSMKVSQSRGQEGGKGRVCQAQTKKRSNRPPLSAQPVHHLCTHLLCCISQAFTPSAPGWVWPTEH